MMEEEGKENGKEKGRKKRKKTSPDVLISCPGFPSTCNITELCFPEKVVKIRVYTHTHIHTRTCSLTLALSGWSL